MASNGGAVKLLFKTCLSVAEAQAALAGDACRPFRQSFVSSTGGPLITTLKVDRDATQKPRERLLLLAVDANLAMVA